MLSNISRSKENQAMKFGHLIEYNKRNIFHQKSSKKLAGGLVPDLFWFLKKFYMR